MEEADEQDVDKIISLHGERQRDPVRVLQCHTLLYEQARLHAMGTLADASEYLTKHRGRISDH